jgi:2-haloacid dehalogenase
MTSVVAFDAYGTLLDVNAAVAQHAAAVGPQAARLSELWRSKQLEYSWVLSLMQRYEPFWQLTERALDHALARLPDVPRHVREPLLNAYRSLAAYPDALPLLQTLRERGVRTAVLSNGNAAMLQTAFDSAKLTPWLDRLLSVDDAGVFKTSPKVYALVTQAFGVPNSAVTLVSSNRWDIAGAVSHGFRGVWVNRAGLPEEYEAFAPTHTVSSLSGVAALV